MACAWRASMLAACFSLACAYPIAFAQSPPTNPAADPNSGAHQFALTCAGCHGSDGRGTGKGAPIATQPAVLAKPDAELARIIREGVPGKGMPGMAALGDAKISTLVAYVRQLQRDANGGSLPPSAAGVSDPLPPATTPKDSPSAAKDPPKPTADQPPVPVQSAALAALNVVQADLSQTELRNNWVSYNGDYTGRRYSSLTEVTPANSSHLQLKWRVHTQNPGMMEVTPVVVNGVMFVARSNDAYALDAQTGKLLWHHTRPVTDGLVDDASGHLNRGVAVLGSRVYMETDNAHLVCLDAHTGAELWDVVFATGNKNYGATSVPLIVKNKVLVGVSGGDDGVRGFLAAYDADTGKEAWRFWTIPAPGEKGSESWPGDMYLHGGGATWMPGTYDPELNTLYWGTGNPSPDFEGSSRPGDDLYTSSLLALDPDTGHLKWYFQYNPHDLYDFDAVQTPVLIDTNWQGQPRKLIVSANRNGFIYILDRTTGQYLGSRQFIQSLNWASGIDKNGRPISNNLIPNEAGVQVCPSVTGGTNWFSPTFSLSTGLFYFRALEECTIFQAHPESYAEGQANYGTGTKKPVNAPDADYLLAFDLRTMDFAWRKRLIGDDAAWAGVMSTAGGIIAFGNDAEEFEVDEALTGKRLWAFKLPQQMHASPMAFSVAGRQYFGIGAGDDIFVFGLP